jgi:hypothetical protein
MAQENQVKVSVFVSPIVAEKLQEIATIMGASTSMAARLVLDLGLPEARARVAALRAGNP